MTNHEEDINVIEVEELSKHYGRFKAVDRVSFAVRKGEIFGFLGANGAGKTTVMRMLCGLSKATSGKARVAGYNISNQSNKIKKNIGYMSQKFSLYEDLTVRENVVLFAKIYGVEKKGLKQKIDSMLKEIGLENEIDSMVKSLPLGWRQRLAFSVAIFHSPKIVFLDEPTGGVDPIARRRFWEMIYLAAERGITIFVTTHYMDEAEYCDRVSIMVDGQIEALDSPKNLKTIYDAKTMEEVFYSLARKAKRTED